MILFWWEKKGLIESIEDETQSTPKRDQESRTRKSETVDSQQVTTGGSRWIHFLKFNKPNKVNIGVGDDVVDEEKAQPSFWKRLFRKFRREDESKRETKAQIRSERLDKFVTTLQRKAIVVEKEIMASSVASIFSILLSHPFDVIKSDYLSGRFPRRHYDHFVPPRRVIYVVRHIILTKGLRRFYRGHLASQRDSICQAISMFWTYQQVYQYLNGVYNLNEHPHFMSFVSGFVSATIPVMALYPLNTIRERRDIKRKALKECGPIVAKSITRNRKYFPPIFRNCLSLYLHTGTLYGLRFFFYNGIRDEMILLRSTHDKAISTNPNVLEVEAFDRLSHFELMLAGATAAILGDLLAHPLDVLHSRMRMKALRRQQYHYDHTCRRMGQCVMTILKNESISAFYAGLAPSMLRSMVNMAVQFAVYEKVKNWLNPLFPT